MCVVIIIIIIIIIIGGCDCECVVAVVVAANALMGCHQRQYTDARRQNKACASQDLLLVCKINGISDVHCP